MMGSLKPGVIEQESGYTHLLLNTTAYSISGDTLSLLSNSERVQLVFKAAKPL